ncbi:hypothetical protein B484DRAFT_459599 [Ochromonadaceae sp. CCMP2298]|nr:hypothetical protein B484DRAFT_459599 [Ochromonadaceae sp. CCMP2298]|mmetsp:Transcript_12123/g.27032  ORF Transcript_12123/g.27032 Transcript_12123/m.27032 type:complete len:351 (-) Transcript_12123:119-1171(-)
MLAKLVLLLAVVGVAVRAFMPSPLAKTPLTIHHYDYFKKNKDGTKKEIGRLWKNIIFPGIYTDYADTKDPIKEIKVVTKTASGNRNKNFDPEDQPTGTYNDGRSVQAVAKALSRIAKPAGFQAPTPKMALTVKLGAGIAVLPDIKQYPRAKKPIVMYEFESDAACRLVREACTTLDLTVEFRPCPGTTDGYADQMSTITLGKREVPFMVDDNPSMYRPRLTGSKAIIAHLFDAYGPGAENIPKQLLGSGKGGGKGNRVRKDSRPDVLKLKPLTLYGWEGAKFVTPVREALNELGLAHVFVPCANGSQNRDKLSKLTKGVMQVPYLVDPNTGVAMFESAEIVKYLTSVYTC